MRATKMPIQITRITRRQKHEALQAIADLQARGYELEGPLKELSSDGKEFKRDSYNRRIFVGNTLNRCWTAKLRREVE